MTMDPVKSDSSHVCADNPYEQKLYSMFCGHDKEQRGWLTVDALQQLCTTLELKENGTKLIAALTDRCGSSAPEVTVVVDADKPVRITFKAFKEELLHVLGTETQSAMSSSPVTEEQQQIDQLRRQKDQHGGRLLMLLGSCSPGGGNGSNDCGCGAPVKKKEAGDDDDDDSVEVRMQGNEAVDPSKSSNTPGKYQCRRIEAESTREALIRYQHHDHLFLRHVSQFFLPFRDKTEENRESVERVGY